MDELIWGRNPVLEALRAGRPFNKIMIVGGSRSSMGNVVGLAKKENIPVQFVPRNALDNLTDGANHQGVVASLSPKMTIIAISILVTNYRYNSLSLFRESGI
jgi:23S rRNA (guanosine2251-2'-O)-methyltransferase